MTDDSKEWPYSSQTKEELVAEIKKNLWAFRKQFNVPENVSSDDIANSLAEMFAEISRHAGGRS